MLRHKPTASFQRVLQRAAIHVQSSGREEVTGANVLVAMFAERESHAVSFLQVQGMTRFDAVNYVSHGIAKAPGPSPARLRQVMEEWRLRQESRFAGRGTGAVEDARRKRSQDRLQQNYGRTLGLALTDELTGLYNRRYLFAHLDELIERVNQDGISTALLLLDIDHFKSINDTYGHAAGDGVLREVATRARNGVRSGDLVARFGGQEFVVVMPETDLWIARSLAERLRLVVAIEPFILPVSGKELRVTISIGVTWTRGTGDDRDKVLKRADDALHDAKTSGRNRVVVRAPE